MVNVCEEYGKNVTFNDSKTTGIVFGAINVNCKAMQGNGNNVECVTNAKHLGNVVDDMFSDLKGIHYQRKSKSKNIVKWSVIWTSDCNMDNRGSKYGPYIIVGAKKVILLRVLTWCVGNFRGKVPI